MRNILNKIKTNKCVILSIAVVLGTMISCSPAQKESKPEAIQQLKQVQQTVLTADTATAAATVPAAIPAAATSVEPTAANKSTTAPELNPPHGQPFHRCDIPVGSPLNAAATPAKSAAPAKPAQVVNRTGSAPTLENAARLNNPQPNNSIAPTASNSTPPKLNPPHGQPFHRCDIAVGSPLPQN